MSDAGNANTSQFPMTQHSRTNSSVKQPLKDDNPFNTTVAAEKEDGEKYVFVGQAAAKFHKKTPPWFRSFTAKEQATGPSRGEGGQHITHPQPPNLHTKLKSRHPEEAVFRPHLEYKHTEPQPFLFEQRYQGKARCHELVQKELMKEQQELARKSKF